MAAGRIIIPGWMPALDQNGVPIPNARAFFYENGTTTLATIYANESLTTPLSNPVSANSAGQFPVVWGDTTLRYSVTMDAPYGPPGQPFTFDGVAPSTILAESISDITGLQAALDALQAGINAKQPLDAGLTSLASLTAPNIYYLSSEDVWSAVSVGTGLNFASGTLSATGGGGGGITLPIAISDVTNLQSSLDGKGGLTSNNTWTGTNTFNGLIRSNNAAGTARQIQWLSLGTLRWNMFVDGDAESGSNVGSTWRLRRYSDAGASLGDVFSADRATGLMTIAMRPTWAGFTPYDSNNLVAATAAEYQANTAGFKPLTPNGVWSAAAFVTLTQAATIAVNMAAGINFQTTMTGNRTLGNPSNATPGQTGVIHLIQDGTGGRTLAYSSSWKFPGGTAPVLSTAANARDVLTYHVFSTTLIVATLLKDVK